jgi:hypothetical protein
MDQPIIDDEMVELPSAIKRTLNEAADACEAAFERVTMLEAFVLKIFGDGYDVDFSLSDGWLDARYDFTDEECGLVNALRRNAGLEECPT